MPLYLTPGVYVEEVPSGARPIEAVGTSTPAFVGMVDSADAPVGEPVAVNNWTQYTRIFPLEGPSSPLTLAVHGFFLNGGTRCFVLNVGPGGSLTGTARRPGISTLAEQDEIAAVAAPGLTDAVTFETVLSHCEEQRDRVAILDAPREVSDITALTRVATAGTGRADDGASGRGAEGGSGREAAAEGGATDGGATDGGPGAGAGPDAPEGSPGAADAGGGGPRDDGPSRSSSGRGTREQEALGARQSSWGALYFPWIRVVDPYDGKVVDAPPSGHVAGIWARSDASRGVHKAPANEPVRGAVDLTYRLTAAEQGVLNTAGVNAIRMFASHGIRVWGARTLDGSASEWRYLNVRRLFAMVEESIVQGTSWIVFEPNDPTLWNMIRRDIGSFLLRLHSQGALMGRTPQEAFYVKCDEETNPPEEIDAGVVTTEIGMAPVKPAEFIVFKVSQYAGGASVEQEGQR